MSEILLGPWKVPFLENLDDYEQHFVLYGHLVELRRLGEEDSSGRKVLDSEVGAERFLDS